MKYYYEVIARFANGQAQVYYPDADDAVLNYTSFRQEDGSWVFPRTVDGISTPDWFAADFVVGVTVSPFQGYRVNLKSGGAIFVKPPVTRERILEAIEAEIGKRQETLNALKAELNGHHNPVPLPGPGQDSGRADADRPEQPNQNGGTTDRKAE